YFLFVFSGRRRHTRCYLDWSSVVCSSDLDLSATLARHARDVAMKPGGTERVLHGEPAGRKDHEVDRIDAGRIADRLQHEKDRRVRMVVAHRAHGVEAAQIVAIRGVVAVPGDDIERGVID